MIPVFIYTTGIINLSVGVQVVSDNIHIPLITNRSEGAINIDQKLLGFLSPNFYRMLKFFMPIYSHRTNVVVELGR